MTHLEMLKCPQPKCSVTYQRKKNVTKCHKHVAGQKKKKKINQFLLENESLAWIHRQLSSAFLCVQNYLERSLDTTGKKTDLQKWSLKVNSKPWQDVTYWNRASMVTHCITRFCSLQGNHHSCTSLRIFNETE